MLRLLKSRQSAPVAPEGRIDPLRTLATEAARGKLPAQRTLAAAVGPALLHVLRSILGADNAEVEDTLQEALLALNLALPNFRGECSTLHFACRVAMHTAMNTRRRAEYRARYTPSFPHDQVEALAPGEASPAELLAAARRREALRQMLLELPPPQAEVLTLHTMLGHTVEETAAVLGVPANTVRSRLRSALSALRRRLGTDGVLLEVVKEDA